MTKRLCLLILFTPFFINAQKIISTAGDYFSNSNGSVAFTVGEITIETITSTSNNVTQGFHQNGIAVASINDIDANIFVSVYPNPTSNILKVDLNDFQGISYKIFDVRGRIFKNEFVKTRTTEINLSPFSEGLYLLTLYSNNKKLKTYRIIKS